jgi:hypothetical protein
MLTADDVGMAFLEILLGDGDAEVLRSVAGFVREGREASGDGG